MRDFSRSLQDFGTVLPDLDAIMCAMRPVERLDAYRLAKSVAVRVCIACDQPSLKAKKSVADQLIRAAMSVPANIAEGYALGTKLQLIKFYRIALASNEELRTHIDIATSTGMIKDPDPTLDADMPRVTSMLVGLLKRYGARPTS